MLLVVTRGASSLLYPFEDSNSAVFTFQPHVCSAAPDNTFCTACLGKPLDHKSSAVTGANLATLLLNLKTKVPKFSGRSEYTDAPSPVGACETDIDSACARYASMGGGRGWFNDTSRGGPAGTMWRCSWSPLRVRTGFRVHQHRINGSLSPLAPRWFESTKQVVRAPATL